MSVKVFAPIDGTIGKIEELNDGIFSEKMLGDGFFITSEKKGDLIPFYSPLEKGRVQFIADTKHAFFFEIEKDLNVLMHIGLDTVKLDGKPFENIVTLDQEIDLNTKIVDVNINFIEKAGLTAVCPITINSEKEEYEFKLLNKNKNVKKGELIGEFVLLKAKVEVEKKVDLNNENEIANYFSTDDVYIRNARTINKLVGSQKNYADVYNCMTRLRFKIKDKSQVDVDAIKSLEIVKGIVWNGAELQIIIGQDVYKYKEAVSNINQSEGVSNFDLKARNNNVKPGRKLMQMFSGIMIPCIPVFIGTGLVSAITGLLTWAKIMPSDMSWANMNDTIKNQEWYWVILFALGKTGTMFIGIVIAASASKYFGLRLSLGVVIGVTLCSPSLFIDGDSIGIGKEWKLFYIHQFDPVKVMTDPVMYSLDKMINPGIECCEFKIFVIIFTIWFATKIDNYLLRVINPVFELTVRSFLTFFLSAGLAFIVFLPLWNVMEGILCLIFSYIAKIPGGIAVGAYTALWQMAVTVGMHMCLGIIGSIQGIATSAQGGYGIFGGGSSISVYCMLGAMLGLMVVTKNSALKVQCKGLILCPVLGITEPIIYGIAVPRKRTYWSAITGAFIAGCFMGVTKVTSRLSTGIGIFEAIGYFNYTNLDPDGSKAALYGQLPEMTNGLLYLLTIVIATGSSMGLSILFSETRKKEKNSLSNNVNSLKKLITLNLILKGVSKQEINKILADSNQNFKEMKSLLSKEEIKSIKVVEKEVVSLNKFETKLSELIRKETALKDKLNKKGAKLVSKNKIEEAKSIIVKIQSINNEDKKAELREIISNIHPKYEVVNKIISEKMKELNAILAKEKSVINSPLLINKETLNTFENSLNEMRLEYKIDERKSELDFDKKIFEVKKQIKELKIESKKAEKQDTFVNA